MSILPLTNPSMILDRGTIKWTSLMLPEHVNELRKWSNEDRLEKRPILDEQEFEEIGRVIMDSLNYTLPIKITTSEAGLFTTYSCIVAKVDMLFKHIKLDMDNDSIFLQLNSIVSAERES